MGLLSIQWLCVAITVLLALWIGGRPEQIGSLIIAAASVLDRVWDILVVGPVFGTVDLWNLSLDTAMLVSAYALALTANRIWPMLFASTCLLAVFAHLARAVDLEMYPLVYAVIAQVPFWLSIAVVLIGTITHARSRRAGDAGEAAT
tara:strand:+ start:1143 stop:1583 length:441 start_codon:yes stop_codon:yes gene_type:complete